MYAYADMADRGFYRDAERLRSRFGEQTLTDIENIAERCGLCPPGSSQDTNGDCTSDDPSHTLPQPDANPFPAQPWPFRVRQIEPEEICIERRLYRTQCMTREAAARLYNDGARYWLLRGDAMLSTVDLDRVFPPYQLEATQERGASGLTAEYYPDRAYALRDAMAFWNHSIQWGRPFGAQSALMAQRRLQAHMVQCESSQTSLSRISRRAPGAVGDVISLELRQQALAALGYYADNVDGAYGPATRSAARGFQRELGYDETGSLSPRQVTLLICHAAQTARDPHMQNALGIMYATGLGVAQNTDLSLEWFETAARRDDADAYFNLALIYGTGAVLGSYRMCGIIENPERADAYLRDAARLGHPVAQRWRRHPEFQNHRNADSRWVAIENRLEEAAHERGGDYYLEWRTWFDFSRIDAASPSCLDPEGGGVDAPPYPPQD
ncbi:hypothetical protein DDZ18_00985 [Marinicauda salina]|uniref:Peptidoglycan binding-like domain-containing protein n=2 Tax=Marinicauda salina TaxID=2135793 RepID=A0A2U2BY84_9PROT|nr:hypothetical protein DDZ18_00985 [Marinicauda salina]